MNRALAVVRDTDTSDRLVSHAGELAAGVDAELVILAITREEEYAETREARERAGGKPYSIDQAAEKARQHAESVARTALADVDIEYETLGSVGNPKDRILSAADEHGCDHVFVIGDRRSPTGKAIFGNVAQSVLLNFDGPVTALMDD